MKINVPLGEYITFSVPIDDKEYILSLKYDEIAQMWYIRIKYNKIDTYFCSLTTHWILFPEYRNVLPHCFYCKTITGFNPDKKNDFDNSVGTANLYIDSWENRINELNNGTN